MLGVIDFCDFIQRARRKFCAVSLPNCDTVKKIQLRIDHTHSSYFGDLRLDWNTNMGGGPAGTNMTITFFSLVLSFLLVFASFFSNRKNKHISRKEITAQATIAECRSLGCLEYSQYEVMLVLYAHQWWIMPRAENLRIYKKTLPALLLDAY